MGLLRRSLLKQEVCQVLLDRDFVLTIRLPAGPRSRCFLRDRPSHAHSRLGDPARQLSALAAGGSSRGRCDLTGPAMRSASIRRCAEQVIRFVVVERGWRRSAAATTGMTGWALGGWRFCSWSSHGFLRRWERRQRRQPPVKFLQRHPQQALFFRRKFIVGIVERVLKLLVVGFAVRDATLFQVARSVTKSGSLGTFFDRLAISQVVDSCRLNKIGLCS
jgi:hypothetical protein